MTSSPPRFVRFARALALGGLAAAAAAACGPPEPRFCACQTNSAPDGGLQLRQVSNESCSEAQLDAGCSSGVGIFGPLPPPSLAG